MKVLVIAPHPDDEILGCGGTIAKRAAEDHDVYVCIVTKGYKPLFSPSLIARGRREDMEAGELLGVRNTIFLNFPASLLDTVPAHELNDSLANLVQNIQPDEVYIPHRGDIHTDHQIVADAAMVAVRPKYDHVVKRVYAYETVSETGWNIPAQHNEFIPNVYEDITESIDAKMEAMRIFKSQLEPYPKARSLNAIGSLAGYRGSTIGVPYAEAFMLVREIKMGGET